MRRSLLVMQARALPNSQSLELKTVPTIAKGEPSALGNLIKIAHICALLAAVQPPCRFNGTITGCGRFAV
jgi:hypothetical protein